MPLSVVESDLLGGVGPSLVLRILGTVLSIDARVKVFSSLKITYASHSLQISPFPPTQHA